MISYLWAIHALHTHPALAHGRLWVAGNPDYTVIAHRYQGTATAMAYTADTPDNLFTDVFSHSSTPYR